MKLPTVSKETIVTKQWEFDENEIEKLICEALEIPHDQDTYITWENNKLFVSRVDKTP